jgi:hypothetical protein
MCFRRLYRASAVGKMLAALEERVTRELTTVSDPDLQRAKERLAYLEAQVSIAGIGRMSRPHSTEGDP